METSLVVEPSFCPVTYECVSITEANTSISCDESDFFKIDSVTGTVEVKTSDMERFKPGIYKVVVRGSAGSQTSAAMTEFSLFLQLDDPCPTADISNLQKNPFFSLVYALGDEAIS